MAKPKGINQKAKWRAHSIRLARYADRVQSVYDTLNDEVARLAIKADYDGTEQFLFKDYPATKKKFDEIRAQFVTDMRSVIMSGTSEEWRQSNLVQDLLADKVLKFYGVKRGGKKARVYYQTNNDALKAFQQRKDKGLGLSERLWQQSGNYKEEMEFALSSAIEKGTSAVKLSKRLSKYLRDFPSLKQDYKEKFGKAVTCQDCEYRSIRLARSEINMAYRMAEQERWKQFDFVLGYEVKLTQNGRHVPDICDDLVGKYPKGFVFKGFHSNCLCYCIPILMNEYQFFGYDEPQPIEDLPEGYKNWLIENEKRIGEARERDALPYFFTENEDMSIGAILEDREAERTGRPIPTGNVDFFAGRKYLKQRNGTFDVYGTAEDVARQKAQWKKIDEGIESITSEFQSACDRVLQVCPEARFSGLSRKAMGSAIRKADTKYEGDISQCTDLIRCNFSCFASDYEKVCETIRENLHLKYDLSTAEYMHLDHEDMYLCRFMNPEFKNGTVGEIMVTPFEMVCGREGKANAIKFVGEENYKAILKRAKAKGIELHRGHDFYEDFRIAKTEEDRRRLYGILQDYYRALRSL